jgi:DNA sulfur modification protein DndD
MYLCTALEIDSEQRKSVEKILNSYCNSEFNESVSQIDKAIGSLESLRPEIQDMLLNLSKKRTNLQEQLKIVQEEIDDISEQLENKDDQEIVAWEQGLKKVNLTKREKDQEIAQLRSKNIDLNSRLEALRTQIRDSKLKEEKAAIVQRRLNSVDSVVSTLSHILRIETQELRGILNNEIKTHFEKIILKNFFAEIDDSFTLRIRKKVHEDKDAIDVAKSMGENQITSLVFIASLVHIARKRDEIPTILKGLQGGEYPVCMDSPFGQLGEYYRGKIAMLIPELSPQVLVFVSPSQWGGAVEDNMKNRVGRHYLLVYNGDQPPAKISHQVNILNRSFDHFQHDSFEHTTILELEDL